MQAVEIKQLADKLTNADLELLLTLVSTRIIVFNEHYKALYELREDNPVSINGSAVQLNVEFMWNE
tara:strand:+ start:627 stop:824 length:198 start_codon:yes stop_codon:yes gene_type:complete